MAKTDHLFQYYSGSQNIHKTTAQLSQINK